MDDNDKLKLEIRRLEDRLYLAISGLNSLAKPNNLKYQTSYEEILNDVMEEVLETICEEYDSREGSLATWINKKKRLYYKIQDAYQESSKFPTTISMQGTLSQRREIPSLRLDGLDKIIEEEQKLVKAQAAREIAQAVRGFSNYIRQDPDKYLQQIILKDREGTPCKKCNFQTLALRLFVRPFDQKISLGENIIRGELRRISTEFNIPYNTLYSRIRHPDRPGTLENLLAGLAVEFRLAPSNKFKSAIKDDPKGHLKQAHVKNHPQCNCQFIALRLFYLSQTRDFNEISRELQERFGYRLRPTQVENFWNNRCRSRLGKAVLELKSRSKEVTLR